MIKLRLIRKQMLVLSLLSSSFLWAETYKISAPFDHLNLQQKLALEMYRFELSPNQVPSDWLSDTSAVTAVCLRGYPPLIFMQNRYYDLDHRSSLYQPELLPLPYPIGKLDADYNEFDRSVRGQCESISQLRDSALHLQQTQVVRYQQVISDSGDYNWQLLVKKNQPDYVDSLTIFSTDRLLHRFQMDDPGDRFIRFKLVEFDQIEGPLIVSVWIRGVHGEQLVIHHPLSDSVIFQQTSLWPLNIIEEDDQLLIDVTESGKSSDMPLEKRVVLTADVLQRSLSAISTGQY